MTADERHASALVAACAREASAHLLAYARDAGLDPPSFLVSVAAVLASAALAAQPEGQRPAAARHLQNALELVHGLGVAVGEAAPPPGGFAAPEALQ